MNMNYLEEINTHSLKIKTAKDDRGNARNKETGVINTVEHEVSHAPVLNILRKAKQP